MREKFLSLKVRFIAKQISFKLLSQGTMLSTIILYKSPEIKGCAM